ncbi:argininosuccinate lyase [Chelativorans sp. YIM 93263]|uniref:argininosuccinate lyase n=1 Tax=Chelativorans sp. YIM 93263 TaxID=2906648 RepID=UPI002379A277|nr:argininosuccinate lyase [Chelativorans sp. YIM 93263]
MESKVSGFLKEAMAPEIQNNLMAPALERTFPVHLPLITEINMAHVLMLTKKGIIDRNAASKLARAVIDLQAGGPSSFTLNPALEDSYFNYEARLIETVGPDVGGRVHIGRSRNDLKATLDRMRARKVALQVMADLLDLRSALVRQGRTYTSVIAPGYTHLQPAQPITFGYYLLGVAHGIERDYQRIADCYTRINKCPLGAAAIAGTSFPIDRKMTALALGFDGVAYHAQDAIATRDTIIELLSSCTLLSQTIGRMAQDFYVMTTYEFGTLSLPDSVAITSSIMPQKKNMAALEILKGRVAAMTGALVTALSAYKAVPYSHAQDGNMEGMRWTWDAFEEVVAMVPVATLVAERAEPAEERMLELVRGNFSTVTDLADTLVRETEMSFREAHHLVGRVVRIAIAEELKADQITGDLLDRAASETVGRKIGLPEPILKAALDPIKTMEAKTGSGGPSAADIATMADDLEANLREDAAVLARRKRQVEESNAVLVADFNELARQEDA